MASLPPVLCNSTIGNSMHSWQSFKFPSTISAGIEHCPRNIRGPHPLCRPLSFYHFFVHCIIVFFCMLSFVFILRIFNTCFIVPCISTGVLMHTVLFIIINRVLGFMCLACVGPAMRATRAYIHTYDVAALLLAWCHRHSGAMSPHVRTYAHLCYLGLRVLHALGWP